MADEIKAQLPHLIVTNTVTTESYTKPKGGGAGSSDLPARDRQKHASQLIQQLDALRPFEKSITHEQKDFGSEISGIYVTFESNPGLDLQLKSLENQPSKIELCSSHLTEENITSATVFVPEGKLDHFLKKVTDYRDKDTRPNKDGNTKPLNQPLIDSISEIKLAVLESLWTDDKEQLPLDNKSPIWWEVWIRLSDKADNEGFFREKAEILGLRLNPNTLYFVNRAVILAYGTKESIIRSISLLGIIAELRRAKETAGFFAEMGAIDQSEWVDETAGRLVVSPEINTYACLLDSGMNEGHPLLAPIAASEDMHSYEPVWGTHDGNRFGHGTPMAGLTSYGDLTDVLASDLPIEMTHKLESVKIIPNWNAGQNDPELYGAITREGIARVEVENVERKRVFCMAVTTTDNRDRGKPSSWSATIDAIASGKEDDKQRLIILSAGNTDITDRIHYPDSNHTDTVHDPGQSWNALTVGGYTEKILINDPDLSNYEPLANSGDLAPSSCTSTAWNSNWPFKPDIVMEAGNMGINRASNDLHDDIDDLQLLSTHHEIREKLLATFGDTSAASALATRLSTMLLAEYPDFWPETLRGLLIHAAEWTEALKSSFDLSKQAGYRQLLQYCGYGVPNPEKLFWSTTNSLTLIAQDQLQPYTKEGSTIKTRDINLHQIPWPKDILESLGATEVEMKVTLSYFIEPNPAQRGWATKYRYASHRLQFDVKRSLENLQGFKQRINQQARDTEYNKDNNVKETGDWLLGSKLRGTGSIHSDTWRGTATDLASREFVAVYPMTGWWKELKSEDKWANLTRYSLIISLTTPETDIYTEVANYIRQEVEIL